MLAENTVVDAATAGALMNALLTYAGPPPAPGVARPIGPPVTVTQALAAYTRWVHFKSASLGLLQHREGVLANSWPE